VIMQVHQKAIFEDNYVYLIEDKGNCVVIDPGESTTISKWVKELGFNLTGIWITHHHNDHVGGVSELKDEFECRVWGPLRSLDVIKEVDVPVSQGDKLSFGGIDIDVIETPGHTLDHVCYYVESEGWLFCGDSLFAMGCGRLFEGDALQQWESLKKLRQLPEETLCFCGHEYTYKNLQFAVSVMGSSTNLEKREKLVIQALNDKKTTMPFKILEEKQTNPFMLCDNAYWKEFFKMPEAKGEEVFAALRSKRDVF
jgi:hydroxyacylglutathione hydrolase